MSQKNEPADPHAAEIEAEIEAEVEMLSELLVHEFSAVERAVDKVRAASEKARDLADLDLLNILSRLRVARAVDDYTSIYLDLKDEEAETARELLEELGDDDFDDFDFDDDEFADEDEDEDDEDDDDQDDDEDDFGTFDDDDDDDR